MSDFGVFDAVTDSDTAPARRAKVANDRLAAAIDEVRAKYGAFLLGATGLDEFDDRFAFSRKHIVVDVLRHVPTYPKVMRAVHGALKAEYKAGHYRIGSNDEDGDGLPDGADDEDSKDRKKRERRERAKEDRDDRRKKDRESSRQARRRTAEDRDAPPLDTDETFAPSDDNLVPDGDFAAYLDAVDQDGPERVEAADFGDGGDSGSDGTGEAPGSDRFARHRNPWGELSVDINDGTEVVRPAELEPGIGDDGEDIVYVRRVPVDREAARVAVDLYADWAASNGLQAASRNTLHRYAAAGISDTEFHLLAGVIRRLGGEDDGPYAFGGDDGESDDVLPDDAADDFDVVVSADAVDAALDASPGTVEDALLDGGYIDADDLDYDAEGGYDDDDDEEDEEDEEEDEEEGEEEGEGDGNSVLGVGGASDVAELLGVGAQARPRGEVGVGIQARRRRAFGEGQQVDPTAQGGPMGGDPAVQGMDPSMMGMDPSMTGGAPPVPQPGQAEDQPAEDDLLGMASQAVDEMIQRETMEYQQIVDPLTQALQAIQYAQAVEQGENPLDVMPQDPSQVLNVDPSQAPDAQAAQAAQEQMLAQQGGGGGLPPQLSHRQADLGPGIDTNGVWHPEVGFEQSLPITNLRLPGTVPVVGADGKPSPQRLGSGYGYGPRSDDIAGYTYNDQNWNPRELIEALVAAGELSPAARDMDPEDVLDQHAEANAIDRHDERSFDSSEFPKVIFQDQLDPEYDSDWYDGYRQAYRIARAHRLTPEGHQAVVHALRDRRYADVAAGVASMHPSARRRVAASLADLFSATNPRFLPNKFYTAAVGDTGSRRPFDAATRRRGGETKGWTPTQTLDSFEFPGSTQKNVITDDHMTVNNLPKMDGQVLSAGHRHSKGRSRGVMNLWQDWSQSRADKGLNHGGLPDVGTFASDTGVGDKALTKLKTNLGLEKPAPHSSAEASPAGTKGSSRRRAGFFTRRVPGWSWDDHLSGYITTAARDFTCSCGQAHPTPSYNVCKCGKIWNSYVIGSGDDKTASVDMYVCREIPVRPNVIVAGRRHACTPDCGCDDDDDGGDGGGRGDVAEGIEWVTDAERQDADAPHAPGRVAAIGPDDHVVEYRDGEKYCRNCGALLWDENVHHCPARQARRKTADWTVYDDDYAPDGPDGPPDARAVAVPADWARRDGGGRWVPPLFAR